MNELDVIYNEVQEEFEELLRYFAFRRGLINRAPWHDIVSRTLSQFEPGDWLAQEQSVRAEMERCG